MTQPKPTVFIFVNGILTLPGASKNWNRRAVTHVHTQHAGENVYAESLEYFALPFRRPPFSNWRAQKLARKLAYYIKAGFDIIPVAHSNGANVLIGAIKLLREDKEFARSIPIQHEIIFRHVHLFAPAADPDMERNGLNSALQANVILTLHIYRGGKDWPLRIANTLPGAFAGFGALGYCGPRNMTKEDAVKLHDLPYGGHGTWFEPTYFPNTLRNLLTTSLHGR